MKLFTLAGCALIACGTALANEQAPNEDFDQYLDESMPAEDVEEQDALRHPHPPPFACNQRAYRWSGRGWFRQCYLMVQRRVPGTFMCQWHAVRRVPNWYCRRF